MKTPNAASRKAAKPLTSRDARLKKALKANIARRKAQAARKGDGGKDA